MLHSIFFRIFVVCLYHNACVVCVWFLFIVVCGCVSALRVDLCMCCIRIAMHKNQAIITSFWLQHSSSVRSFPATCFVLVGPSRSIPFISRIVQWIRKEICNRADVCVVYTFIISFCFGSFESLDQIVGCTACKSTTTANLCGLFEMFDWLDRSNSH